KGPVKSSCVKSGKITKPILNCGILAPYVAGHPSDSKSNIGRAAVSAWVKRIKSVQGATRGQPRPAFEITELYSCATSTYSRGQTRVPNISLGSKSGIKSVPPKS